MTGNDDDVNMQPKEQPPVSVQNEAWLLPMEATAILPFVFSIPGEHEAHGPGIENCPSVIFWLATSKCVDSGLLLQWMALLGDGGKVRLGLSRSDESTAWVTFEVLEKNESKYIDIEVSPSVGFLREEWERQSSAQPQQDETTREFGKRLLDSIPIGCAVPLPPREAALAQEPDRVAWIEEHLARKGKPLADLQQYTTSKVSLCFGEDQVLLVTYAPRRERPKLQEWIGWVQDHVPGAFYSPLLSRASPPPRLPAIQVVEVALDDLLDAAGLAEIEIDSAGAEDRVRTGFADLGSEALGWYQPYHKYDEGHWGIYLFCSRILDLGRVLCDRLSKVGCPQPIAGFELAMRLILEHELFHARMETFALGLELSGSAAIYKPYNETIYQKTLGTDRALEEAIANYTARETVQSLVTSWIATRNWKQQHVSAVMDFIDESYRLSPPGYRHWYLAADPLTWRRLAAQTITGTLESIEPLVPLDPFLKSPPIGIIELPQIPIWIASEDTLPDRLFGTPPRREVERMLKKRGYQPRSGKGSHTVWVSEDGTHFALPEKTSLSRLVFRNLLHHLGMSKEQYLAARSTI